MPQINLTPGVKFMLDKSTPAIYIGPGGCRGTESVQLKIGDTPIAMVVQEVFKPVDGNYIVAWWYKAEWYLSTYHDLLKDYPRDAWVEGWSIAAEQAVTQRLKYVE
jgi:hypothetical protein